MTSKITLTATLLILGGLALTPGVAAEHSMGPYGECLDVNVPGCIGAMYDWTYYAVLPYYEFIDWYSDYLVCYAVENVLGGSCTY